MAIRHRLTPPKARETGLIVLHMLLSQGIERTKAIKAIGHHLRKIWALDAEPSRIVAAELDDNRNDLVIMTKNTDITRLDLSDVFA